MPGIDFPLLRRQLALSQALDLLGFTPTTRRGPLLRGPCPLHGSPHGSAPSRSRSFAADLGKNCWRCFHCGAGGNALDLYLAATKMPVYEGTLELCSRLHLPVPRRPTPALHRQSRSPPY